MQSHIVLMTTQYLFAEKIAVVYDAHFAGDHFMKEVFDVFEGIVRQAKRKTMKDQQLYCICINTTMLMGSFQPKPI